MKKKTSIRLSSIKKFYNSKNGFLIDVAFFMIITYGFHLLYKHYEDAIMSIAWVHSFQLWLADVAFDISFWINESVLKLKVTALSDNVILFLNGKRMQIVDTCSAFKQYYQVLVLFILFPGQWKHKLWFIPMSIFVMFATNIFRIVALSLIMVWKPEFWDFSHTWILRPFFYVILFLLWVWWVECFSRKKTTSKKLSV